MTLEYELPDGTKKRFRVNGMVAFPWARAICNHPGVAGSIRIIGNQVQVWFDRDGGGDYQVRIEATGEWSPNRKFSPTTTVDVR